MSCKTATLGQGHIRREHVLNPITALAFYQSPTNGKQYVLAGEDTDIKVYDVHTSRFCGQLPVFRAQSIHGIVVSSEDASQQHRLILVWGGHSIKVIPGDILETLISSRDGSLDLAKGAVEARAPDWIFDGRVSPFGDGRIVLLTAHNEVILAHVDAGRNTLVFDSTRSPSRPILYSGNFFWVSKDCVLVAAGTVFGEILVWKCHLCESPEGSQNSEVLFVFTGHEGSIFGVHISPEIQTAKGETLRLLASCSDDRTIRVWNITERHGKQEHMRQEYETHISGARETGFGNNVDVTIKDEDGGSARCVATVMGHISRIWQVEFPQVQALSHVSDVVELYSFGEDATAQKWYLSLGPAAQVTHQSTFSSHSGKHIWSHATASTTSGDLLVATGGADGKVALIGAGSSRFPPVISSNGPTSSTDDAIDRGKAVAWSLADVTQSCQRTITAEGNLDDISKSQITAPSSVKPKNARAGFNRYTFVSDKRLLAATNSGRVFAGTFDEDTDNILWAELNLPDEIGQIVFSHALLRAPGANPMAFVGTTGGEIYYFDELGAPSLRLLTKIEGKVAQIFCLSNATKSHVTAGEEEVAHSGNCSEILVTTLRSTRAAIVHIDPDDLTTRQLEVTLEPGFMVTAAAFSQGYLIIGSRKGAVAVFHRLGDDRYALLFTFVVQVNEAITSLLPLRSRDGQSHNYVLSTCRDGKYRIHEIITTGTDQATAAAAVLLHEVQPPFVSSIEGAWLSSSSSDNGDHGTGAIATKTRDLMLCGFRSHSLVVWNETHHHRHEVATVDCGGSSRSYAWTPRASAAGAATGGFRFVFTKAGCMRVFSQARDPHATLKPGGHGREIKTVSVSASGRYIATAAEDTVIRIWEYGAGKELDDRHGNGNGEKHLRCVAALEKHAAGIQALKWVGDEHLFSSAGNEEFFAWRVRRLDSDDFAGLAVVCEAVFPDRTAVGDARITDFDVSYDARDGFRISMALSNSTLQTYAYTKEAGFRPVGKSAYTGACLTQIRHLGDAHVLTAATDGHLAVYAIVGFGGGKDSNGTTIIEAENVPVVTKLHQNTIKSLDVRQVVSTSGSSEYIVVTGGDDNALGFTHISLSLFPSTAEGPDVVIKSKSIVRSAHAAAITGVALAPPDGKSKDGNVLVVTSSNDQRVRLWRLGGWKQRQSRAQLLEERYSSVADAGDLEVFDEVDTDGEEKYGYEDGHGVSGERSERAKEDRRRRKVVVVGVGIEIWELDI
ncbi:WD40 repeat-like protein [Hypoxylon sp. FL1150]|nr:WD40 repeat-like protein [Hypoxylon sp. FL1150]